MNPSHEVTERVRIGRLAKDAGVLPSTVRYYVKEGLLRAVAHTRGGFFLFDREEALKRIAYIQSLKAQRFTLAEIREQFLGETK